MRHTTEEFIAASGISSTVPLSAANAYTPTTPNTLPLPGVVIFVHGVNSMGEWFEESEHGLCEGLNQRMARLPETMQHGGVAGGCLQPNSYADEIDIDGNIIDATAKRFLTSDGNNSPVIRFRWGYRCAPGKAGLEGGKDKMDPTSEVSHFATEVMLNKDDAWGGGPFQNGTSCLGDLWGPGLTDRMFYFLNVQQFNATARTVFRCPTRQYMVHAAQRLADLIADIRATQPGCPINVVCHSQGNMIGLAAALMAKNASDVADNYVLCNPPYSLEYIRTYSLGDAGPRSVNEMFPSRSTRTDANRTDTFRNFLQRIKSRGDVTKGLQPLDKINARIENTQDGNTYFKLTEQANYEAGIDRENRGKVFLYTNPHDQVIGVSTIQGIGWKGITPAQMSSLGTGNFFTRIWAEGIKVGDPARTQYHYWNDHWDQEGLKVSDDAFWYPPSPRVKFILANSRYDQNPLQWLVGTVGWLIQGISSVVGEVIDALKIERIDTDLLWVNGKPDKDHVVVVNAPAVPKIDGEYVTPRSVNAGKSVTRGKENIVSREFDEGVDRSTQSILDEKDDSAARRDARMEERALQRVRDTQKTKTNALNFPGKIRANKQYKAWFKAEPQNATDHSVILKNPEHARRVLAYDLAIGVAQIPPEKWAEWRKKAHWRFVNPREDAYYKQGVVGGGVATAKTEDGIEGTGVGQTVRDAYPENSMPGTIVDRPPPREAFAINDTCQEKTSA